MADKLFPVVKRLAGISTLMTLGFVVVFHFRDIVSTLGSYAIGAEVLFLLAIALVSYRFGFGLTQGQRSAMALAMATRNGAPMLAVFSAFPDQDPRTLVMILLSGPVPAIVALPRARSSRPGPARALGRQPHEAAERARSRATPRGRTIRRDRHAMTKKKSDAKGGGRGGAAAVTPGAVGQQKTGG